MAFNPFHIFRKYSKTMFAVLTIVCMFIFVLSSGIGRGDFFTDAPTWLGGGSSKYPEVARLDGKKIDAQQLNDARRKREIANIYMFSLVNNVHGHILERVQKRLKDLPAGIGENLQPMLMEKMFATNPQFGPQQAYGLMSQGRGQRLPAAQALQQHLFRLRFTIDNLKRDNKPDDAELLEKFRQTLEYDLIRLTRPGGVYFAGGISGEDLLDFLAWKWIADKHDIRLAPESVDRMIEAETLGESLAEMSQPVEEGLRKRYRGLSPEYLREALNDEFRVRVAQEYLMGEGPRRDNVPAYVTPYEMKKYYDDMRRTVRVALLPLNVKNYLAEVKEVPTEADLRKLFEEHKKEEWQPDSEQPGFKEPKRIKLQWIAGKPDTPYWRKAGLETAQREGLAGVALATSLPATPLGGIVGPAALVGSVLVKSGEMPEAMLETEYRQYQSHERLGSWTYSGLFFFNIHERSVVRPQAYTALVAAVMASRGTGGSVLDPWMTLGAHAVTQEMRERLRFGLQSLSALGNPAAGLGMNDGWLPEPLPLNTLRGQLTERVSVKLAKTRFEAEFNKFQEELKKKSKDAKKPEVKQEIEKYIAEFVKKHNLTEGASKELHDQYSLANDPGLKPLKDQYFKEELRKTADPDGRLFSQPYFTDLRGMPSDSTALYDPQWFENRAPSPFFGSADDIYYLTWKTDESDARIRSFDAARKEVEEAWRQLKARELAKQAAESLQKDVRGEAVKDLARLRDFASQRKIEPVELNPMARAMVHPALQPGMPQTYMSPSIGPDKVQYPSREMYKDILDLRDKPIGEAIVISDRPKSHYYVCVLVGRDEATEAEFERAYARSMPDVFGAGDELLRGLEFDRRTKFRKEFVAQLREDAKLTVTSAEELKKFETGAGGGPADE
jgi:hypothetical protein